MTKGASSSAGAAAVNWLSNPALPYVVAGLGAVVAGWLLVRLVLGQTGKIYEGAKSGVQAIYNDVAGALDRTRGEVVSIVGAPTSQVTSERTPMDTAKGVLVPGDRALSDIWDASFGRMFK